MFAVFVEIAGSQEKEEGSWVSAVLCSWLRDGIEGQSAEGEAGVGLGRSSFRAPLLQARKLKAAPTR